MHLRLDNARGNPRVEVGSSDAITTACSQAAGAEPPKVANPFAVALEANVRRLNIDVERIVPIHGRIVPYSELLAAIGKKPAPAKN